MDFRQLSTLIAIADHGSFSAAARALYTVQSNVSAHIGRLEKELGSTLIDRQTGRMTDDGRRVLERARRIMHEMDDIRSDMESNDHDVSGDVRLGVIGTIARWAIPPMLRQMADSHPRLHAVVTEGSSSALAPNVVSGLLNAAILHLPIDDPDLVIEPLFDEELLLLAPHDHPLSERESIDITDLDGVPLLLPPAGAGLRRIIERSSLERGVSLNSLAEVDSMRLLAALAVDGHGATIVPATALSETELVGAAMVHVSGLPRRRVAWVRRQRPNPSAATRAVHDVISNVIGQRISEDQGLHSGEQ